MTKDHWITLRSHAEERFKTDARFGITLPRIIKLLGGAEVTKEDIMYFWRRDEDCAFSIDELMPQLPSQDGAPHLIELVFTRALGQ